MTSTEDKDFGLRLYEELRRLGGTASVTWRMNYAAIQQLKAADRAATVKLFHGCSYVFLQRLKTDSPEEAAAFLVQQQMAAAAALAGMVIWM